MSGEKFKFGDILENGWAGEGNPHKRGVYLWTFTRNGRLNPGKYSKVRHDDGKLGEWPIDAESKTSVVGTIFDGFTARIEQLEEAMGSVAAHLDCEPDDDSILHTIRELQADFDIQKDENERLTKALEVIASATARCGNDGGFDREIGPIGCNLGDKCVCIGIHPVASAALLKASPSQSSSEGK